MINKRMFWMALTCLLFLTGCSMLGEGSYSWPNNTRPHSYWAELGDLDGDGDLDAYLANGENEGVAADTVWLNDGRGLFSGAKEQPDESETHFVALGDLDGDGDLDGVVDVTGAGRVAMNDGKGNFTYSSRYLYADDSGAYIYYPALGDLDGDGDLDLVLGGCCGAQTSPPNGGILPSYDLVWLNDGKGNFTDSGQRLGGGYGTGMLALGDLDGDGDLDLFDANTSSMSSGQPDLEVGQPDMVWLNDGNGNFRDSGQRLGKEESNAVALGDLDGDGDLDAFVGIRGADEVWLNDGQGTFSDSGQRLGDQNTLQVTLSDQTGDGDLDAFTWGRGFVETWANVGDGTFEKSGWIKLSIWEAAALGDVNGDGRADLFAGLLDKSWHVWLNEGVGGLVEYRPKR
jgi:hypothetical protein